MKKVLIGLAAVVGLLVVLAGAAFLLVDPKAFVEKKKDELARQTSEQLGRTLTIGPVTATVFPTLEARVQDVKLSGPVEGAPPQAAIAQVDVKLDLWKAVFSAGQILEVDHVVINGLALRASRDAQGKWDFDDVLRKLEAEAAKKPQTEEAPADLSFLRGAKLARFTIANSRVDLNDAALGRPLAATDLFFEVSDVVLGQPLVAKLKTVLEDQGKKAPIDVGVRFAALPEDLSFDPPPDASVDVKIADLDVSGWGALLPPDAVAPAWGTVRTDVTATSAKGGNDLKLAGVIYLRGFQLRDAASPVATPAEVKAAPRGQPLDLDVDVAVALDRAAPRYTIQRLALKGSGVDVQGALDATGTSPADLVTADVKATVAELGKVLAVLPPSIAALPPEVKIEGPLAAAIAATASDVTASVSLDSARVRYGASPDAPDFDKAAGKPLNLKVHGAKKGDVLDVDQFALVLDTAKIGGKLVLPVKDGAPLSADVTSGPVTLASLRGVVPPFARALGAGKKVDGTVELTAKANAQGAQQTADVSLKLSGFDVALDRTTARGGGTIAVKAQPSGETLKILAEANLDGFAVKSVDETGATTLDKPAGVPLRLDVDATKGATRADIAKAAIAIGKSTIAAKGAVTGLGGKSPAIDLDFGNVDVAFDDVRAAVPGAAKLPAGGRLKTALKVKGAPDAMSTLIVDAKNLDVAFGSSRIAGDVQVTNLDEPQLAVDLTTVNLAFDDVRPMSEGAGDLPAGGRFQGALKMRGDTARDDTVDVGVTVAKLEVPGSKITGTIQLKSLEKPRFVLDLKADSLDVDKLAGTGGDDAKKDAPKKPGDNPHGLSKSTREMLANVSGTGTLKADRAIVKTVPVTNFVGKLTMTRGVLSFDTLDFDMYGGRVSATGTVLDLPAERTGYDLKMKMKNVDIDKALAAHTSLGGVFSGKLSPELDVKGKGLAWQDLVATLEGPAVFQSEAITVETLDLLGPIGAQLKAATKSATTFKSANAAQGTTLKDVLAVATFKGGKMQLKKPMQVATNQGKLTLDGAAFLDKRLDFTATLDMTPDVIATLTGGSFKPKTAIPVPMKIGGTWDAPRITGVDVSQLAAAMGGAVVEAVAGQAVDKVSDVVGDKLGDKAGAIVKDAADPKKVEAEAKKLAEAEKKKAAAEAKKLADAEKKKAEAEAKKRAADAKKKAEAEAKKKLGGIFGK